ncbi:unnamed protein product, partial [Phaeothamnion confervicola]
LSSLLAVGLDLTKQAEEVIKAVKAEHKENTHIKGHTDEGVVEPVTDADQRSNRVFVNGFRRHFAGITLLSEETEPEEGDFHATVTTLLEPLKVDPWLNMDDVMVTIDPLDATKEFTEDLTQYVTTMVCIVYKGEPIAGIINQVFEPKLDPVWGVIPMEGVSEGVHGRTAKPAEGAAANSVTISRSHTGAGGDVVTKYFKGRQALKAGGAGFKALLVVDGEADAYVHVTKIKSWDVCAAEAVIKAMGGGFSDVDGKPLTYNMEDPLFVRGLVATASKTKQNWYLDQLGGNLA